MISQKIIWCKLFGWKLRYYISTFGLHQVPAFLLFASFLNLKVHGRKLVNNIMYIVFSNRRKQMIICIIINLNVVHSAYFLRHSLLICMLQVCILVNLIFQIKNIDLLTCLFIQLLQWLLEWYLLDCFFFYAYKWISGIIGNIFMQFLF